MFQYGIQTGGLGQSLSPAQQFAEGSPEYRQYRAQENYAAAQRAGLVGPGQQQAGPAVQQFQLPQNLSQQFGPQAQQQFAPQAQQQFGPQAQQQFAPQAQQQFGPQAQQQFGPQAQAFGGFQQQAWGGLQQQPFGTQFGNTIADRLAQQAVLQQSPQAFYSEGSPQYRQYRAQENYAAAQRAGLTGPGAYQQQALGQQAFGQPQAFGQQAIGHQAPGQAMSGQQPFGGQSAAYGATQPSPGYGQQSFAGQPGTQTAVGAGAVGNTIADQLARQALPQQSGGFLSANQDVEGDPAYRAFRNQQNYQAAQQVGLTAPGAAQSGY